MITNKSPEKSQSSTVETESLKSQLQSIQDKYSQLLSHDNVIQIELDINGNVILIEGCGLSVLEYEPEELIGKNFFSVLFSEVDFEKLTHQYKSMLQEDYGTLYLNECDCLNKSNKKCYFDWKSVVKKNSDGESIGLTISAIDITDYINTKNILVENQVTLDKVEEIAQIGSWDWNVKTNKLKFSPELYKIYGISPEEFDGNMETLYENIIHPNDRAGIARATEISIQKGIPQQVTFRILHKDGSIRHVWGDGTVAYNEQGEMVRMIGIIQDITEHKKIEVALRRSESHFRNIINASPVALALNDEDNNITYLNSSFTNTFGYSLEDIPTLTQWWELAYPDESYRTWISNAWQENIENSKKYNTPFEPLEVKIQCKNGTKKTVIASAAPLTKKFKGNHLVTLFDVTERKKAEIAYHKSESRYRKIVETAQEGIWTIDAENKTSFVNPIMAQMLGYSEKQMLGSSLYDFMDEEGKKDAEQNVERRKNGVAEKHEFKFICKDGTALWVELNTSPLLNDDGNYVGALAMITDITERRQAEKDLKNSQKLLLRTENLAQVGSWDWDLRSDNVTWSPEMYRIYDYDPLEYADMTFSIAMARTHPDDMETIKNYVQIVLHSGKSSSVEYRLKLDDDSVRYVWSECEIIVDDKGNRTHLVGFVQDISNRKLAEQRLQKQKEEQKLLIDNISTALIAFNEKGEIDTFNTAAQTMFGYSLKEILNKNIQFLIPSVELEGLENYLSRYFLQYKLKPMPEEVKGMRNVGEIFPMNLSITELPESTIGGRRFIAACLDITVEKQQEEQLRRAQKMDALGMLTGGIAHDYNNMLGVILGYSKLLKEEMVNQPKQQRYIDEINHASKRGTKLSRKLLAFSRNIQLEAEVLDMNEMLHLEKEMLEKTLTPRIKLEFDLDPNLWLIYVNSGDFEDAILNLCINAMHAMPAGGEINIRTRNRKMSKNEVQQYKIIAGNYVELKISDTGKGIDQEDIKNIFDPFFTTKGERGVGLGLSTVYGFVIRSGGDIFVESTPGTGSHFTLFFPKFKETKKFAKSKQVIESSDLRGSETVLVVDDEKALVNLSYEILTEKGYKVLTASSGKEAISIVKKEPIDLLLSDVIMPEIDGYELVSQVKRINPAIKIQLVSGYTDKLKEDEDSEKYEKELLAKPFTNVQLLKTVRIRLDEKNPAEVKKTILIMDDDSNARELYRINLNKLGFDVVLTEKGEDAVSEFQNAFDEKQSIDVVILDLNVCGGMDGKKAAELILSIDGNAKIIVATGDTYVDEVVNFTKYGFKAVLNKDFDREEMSKIIHDVIGGS